MTPNRNTTLIERYRSSDDEQRTYLFLSHPKLRREFMQFDLDDCSIHIDAKSAYRPHPVIIVGAGLNGLAAAYAVIVFLVVALVAAGGLLLLRRNREEAF